MKLRTVFLAGAAALLPVAISAAPAETAGVGDAARFAPPTTDMVMTRTLVRSLSGGKQIVVKRRYAIRFVSEPQGYRVDGELIDTQVEAPPILAGLAEIERKRPDNGLFPARLDHRGMIVQGGIGAVDPAVQQAAVVNANAMIGRAVLATDAKQERSKLLGQVTATQTGSAWPAFLFNPGHRERVESRRVSMPDGSEGVVEVRIRAEGLMPGGIAHIVERTITTRLAGTVRTSREIWTIESSIEAPPR